MDRRVDKREEKGRGIIKKTRKWKRRWRRMKTRKMRKSGGKWTSQMQGGMTTRKRQRKREKNKKKRYCCRLSSLSRDHRSFGGGDRHLEDRIFTIHFLFIFNKNFFGFEQWEGSRKTCRCAWVSGLSNDNPYTQISKLDCGKTREMRCPHAKEAVVFQKSFGDAGSESWWSLQQPLILAINSHDKARTKSETAIPRDKMINVAKRKKIWPTWITWVTTYSD